MIKWLLLFEGYLHVEMTNEKNNKARIDLTILKNYIEKWFYMIRDFIWPIIAPAYSVFTLDKKLKCDDSKVS